jgi:two-component system, sensor histidine kinase
MNESDDSNPPQEARSDHEDVFPLPSTEQSEPARSREKVSSLLIGVDDQIEQMRQHVQKILSDEPSPYVPLKSGQVLEKLSSTLREANANLLVASLNANAREAMTAEAHKRQTVFLSMLAHELRNPLAPIAMSIELLGKMPGTSPAIKSLQAILERQTSHLTRLVEDLMDATRINNGKLNIQKSPFQLSQLVAQAVETSQPLLESHQQPVQLEIPPEAVWINGDHTRLTQLLSNLIINASKFSADHSPIALSARVLAGDVILSVKDQGIGISPELQPFVFDLFEQGPVGEGLLSSGLGIGLSLVKCIAELHGGTVAVYSKGDGQGSEFVVTLPLFIQPFTDTITSDARSETARVPLPFIGKHILLIDDNSDINKTMGAFLLDVGHSVDCAENGEMGLTLEHQRAHDVICCDIGMHGMDGFEVARHLHLGSSTARLIAISGYDQELQKEKALQAGFHHYLIKPVSCQTLLDLIDLPSVELA